MSYEVKTKTKVSVVINFMPSWWKGNYGLTFGERYVFDPDYRVELFMFMERTVRQRFPELCIGSEEPEPSVVPPDFGNAITAAAAGCEVVYPKDNYPWNRHLPPEAIPKLKTSDNPEEVFPYKETISQVSYLNRKFGKDIHPVLNSRGILNDAVLIGGTEFFADFAQETENAEFLLNFSYGMLNSVVKCNHLRFGYKGLVMLTNCMIMMVSPTMYHTEFLDYDQNIYNLSSGFGQEFGIHHCGIFDKYADKYRKIPRINFLEIGWNSDIKLALKMFPETIIQYIISATFMKNSSPAMVRAEMEKILNLVGKEVSRFRISIPDLDYGTPDENIKIAVEKLKTSTK